MAAIAAAVSTKMELCHELYGWASNRPVFLNLSQKGASPLNLKKLNVFAVFVQHNLKKN
jgi:hypothetical protein